MAATGHQVKIMVAACLGSYRAWVTCSSRPSGSPYFAASSPIAGSSQNVRRPQADGSYAESFQQGGKIQPVALSNVTIDLDALFA